MIEIKTPDITNLATKAALNSKATEVESLILDITNLATKTALNTKDTVIENEAATPPQFKRLTKIIF